MGYIYSIALRLLLINNIRELKDKAEARVIQLKQPEYNRELRQLRSEFEQHYKTAIFLWFLFNAVPDLTHQLFSWHSVGKTAKANPHVIKDLFC